MWRIRLIAEIALIGALVVTTVRLISLERTVRAALRMIGGACLTVLLIAPITLSLSLDGCELDTASIMYVPNATVRVVATWRCGGLTCWQRYIETEGKRIGESRACEGQNDQIQSVIPSGT